MRDYSIEMGVTCVRCSDCGFTFSEEHNDAGTDDYSCPNCGESKAEAELARLRAENERLAKENANVLAWSRLNKKLTDRVAELEAALRFYAESKWNDNYPGGISYKTDNTPFRLDGVCLDMGDRARAALDKP